LTTPFEKTDAYKLGIIDENGLRTDKKLYKEKEQKAYTVLHKLVFNIKKIFSKVPGLRTKMGTYAAALFLLKDTFKEHVEDPQVFEKEFLKYLKENNIEIDNSITEEVSLENGKLPKGIYKLTNDVIATGEDDEENIDALLGDEVETFEDVAPADTVLGVDVFPVIHRKTKQKIYVSSEDIEEIDIGDLL
jgi:hypothetical protein